MNSFVLQTKTHQNPHPTKQDPTRFPHQILQYFSKMIYFELQGKQNIKPLKKNSPFFPFILYSTKIFLIFHFSNLHDSLYYFFFLFDIA